MSRRRHRRRNNEPRPAPALPTAAAAGNAATTTPPTRLLLPAGILLAVFLLYVAIAWLTTAGPSPWILDIIDGTRLFSIDDAYRRFIYRQDWPDGDLFAWHYVLPVNLLLDGMLSALLADDLLLLRIAHAAAACSTLALVFLSGRRLGLTTVELASTLAIVAFMPVFVFVSLGMYGELWLALFYALAIHAFISGRQQSAVILFSLLPLLRPEGLYLFAPFAFWLLLQRRWRPLAILLAPGIAYGLYVLATVDSLAEYLSWRTELRELLSQVGQRFDRPLGIVTTFNLLWILPATIAIATPALRRYWPALAGAALWLAGYAALVALELSYFEARYIYPALPALALAWPFAVRALRGMATPGAGEAARPATLAILLATVFVAEHALQLDPLRHQFGGDRRWPITGPAGAYPQFPRVPAQQRQDLAAAADAIPRLLQQRPEVDRLLILDTDIFYALDPEQLPRAVKVTYVPTSQAVATQLLDGLFFGMNPGPRMQYTYFQLAYGKVGGAGRALFVGNLQAPGLQPLFSAGNYQVYPVNYARARDRSTLRFPDELH